VQLCGSPSWFNHFQAYVQQSGNICHIFQHAQLTWIYVRSAAGELYVNGVQSTEANHRQAYVEQSDNFYSMLSVAETLTMAAQLQMAPGLPEASKQSYVDNLISVLGLAKVGGLFCCLYYC
jgi:ABC-type nitrate/sulfonate/bicarbonate transport system ATPase subunit